MSDLSDSNYSFWEKYSSFRQAYLHSSNLVKSQSLSEEELRFLRAFEAEKKAVDKIPPTWFQEGFICKSGLNAEQCSSYLMATHKFLEFEGELAIDLSGGLGIDSIALSKKYKRVIYLERDAELAYLAKRNFHSLGIENIEVVAEDSAEWMKTFKDFSDLLYVDPDRRPKGDKKIFSLHDCEPSPSEHLSDWLKKGKQILLKASPMIDTKELLLQFPCELEYLNLVSYKNECKEWLLLLQQKLCRTYIKATFLGTNIAGIQLNANEIGVQPSHFLSPQKFIYVPHVNLLKLSPWERITREFKVEKIGANTHLFTSKEVISDFPGRSFEVLGDFDKKQKNQRLNVISKNHPLKAEELAKRFKTIADEEHYLIAFRDSLNKKYLLRTKLLS